MRFVLYIALLFCVAAQGQLFDKYLPLALQQASGSPSGDAIEVLSPLFYYNPDTIDLDAVSDGNAISGANAWTDASGNGYDCTVGGGTITLNVQSGVGRQVQFTNGWFDIPDVSALDIVPGTDAFTLIWRFGELAPQASGGWSVSKAQATSGPRIGAAFSAANTYNSVNVGGTTAVPSPSNSATANSLAILVVGTSTWNMWVDGTQVITGQTTGTGDPTGQSWNIGGRTDGSFLGSGWTLDLVALIPSAISSGERTAIESEFQIN